MMPKELTYRANFLRVQVILASFITLRSCGYAIAILVFLLNSCRETSNERATEKAIVVENLSAYSQSSGFSDSLQIYLPEGVRFLFGNKNRYAKENNLFRFNSFETLINPHDFKDYKVEQHSINKLVLYNPKLTLRIAIINAKSSVVALDKKLTYDYIFIEKPSDKALSHLIAMNIKRGIFCLGGVPNNASRSLKKKMKIIFSNITTDMLDIKSLDFTFVFFFSNRRTFTG